MVSRRRHADYLATRRATDGASQTQKMATPGARLHLYGKREARPGRKMGHINRAVKS